MMTATNTGPRFLYPQSRQFPFDEACEHIVRALEARNWNVPGITVDFYSHGTGDQKYRFVSSIKGVDFKLCFGRVQGRLGQWNDTAAVSELVVPQKELHVYDEECGPTYYVYVGKRWKKDMARFLNEIKIHSKRRGEARWYLEYKGGCNCQRTSGASFEAIGFLTASLSGDAGALRAMTHTHDGRRAPLLVSNNDLNREYEPKDKEPRAFCTDDVFTEFRHWLEANVLPRILAHPEAVEKIDLFTEAVTPFPATVGPIFSFGEYSDAERVHQGKVDVAKLEPSDRYGLVGNGYRLLSLNVGNDGSVPKVAYEGFRWCGLGEVTGKTFVDELDVPGHNRRSDRESFVFKITPNRAEGVYIADNAPYEARRTELFKEIKPRDRLTDAEVADAQRARARTIIPISEYTGDYEQPVILVCREIGFDEVELVSGPWPVCQYVWLIARRFQEMKRRDLLQIATAELDERRSSGYSEDSRKPYDDAVQALLDVLKQDEELVEAAEAYGRQTFRKTELNTAFIERIVEAATQMRQLGLY